MATEKEDQLIDENLELVGEWEPMMYNEFAISLAKHKKDLP